jgi:ketol-acid reductoisomerase
LSDRLAGATVAVLGFGNQGEAQALNLRANRVEVIVGARPGGGGEARARAHGFPTLPHAEAAGRASIVAVLLPDEVVPAVWPGLSDALARDASVVFAHGFNLLYSALGFPPGGDVVLVSPAGPGHVLKRQRELGTRLPAYIAVHRDASGAAWQLAEAYALRLDCSPLLRTTVREETEVDLFGEQAVLCGGMNSLVRAAFETLVERGYSPEIAYLECVHQLRYLADLLHERGMSGLRRAISGTALFGDLTRGPRVIGEASRREMGAILDEIRSGAFAREWQDESAGGRRRLDALAGEASRHPIEEARRRALGAGLGPGDASGRAAAGPGAEAGPKAD